MVARNDLLRFLLIDTIAGSLSSSLRKLDNLRELEQNIICIFHFHAIMRFYADKISGAAQQCLLCIIPF